MNLTTVDDCRTVLRLVAAAMFEGQEAESLLAAAAGADGEPTSQPGSAMAALKGLQARVDRRRLSASRAATAARARPAVQSFADRLAALPDAVDIERVGACAIVADTTRRASAGWGSQLGEGDAASVYAEVRTALAALRGAVMRLELGASRLG